MNVQRFTDGKLRPANFKSVLLLPNPVEFFVRSGPPSVSTDPAACSIWPTHSTTTLVRDTEMTDFHGQRMLNVR